MLPDESMAIRAEARVLEIVEGVQTDQWRGFWGARVRGGLAPGNWSRNTNPISIWHFYHRGVNTVGRPGGRRSTLLRPGSPRGPTLAGHTQRTQCPQTQ